MNKFVEVVPLSILIRITQIKEICSAVLKNKVDKSGEISSDED